jgi:hypothetical protein
MRSFWLCDKVQARLSLADLARAFYDERGDGAFAGGVHDACEIPRARRVPLTRLRARLRTQVIR